MQGSTVCDYDTDDFWGVNKQTTNVIIHPDLRLNGFHCLVKNRSQDDYA